MLQANVIFHAAEAAYFSWFLFLPLVFVVLVAEAALLWAFNREVSYKVILACAFGMNVASYVAGYWISPNLFIDSGLVVVDPDEHGYGVLDQGPQWQRLAQYGFIQAGLLSIVIELAVLRLIDKLAGLRAVVLPVTLGNCLSYTVLGLAFVCFLWR